ncbi:MAG: hypothetical protein AABX14_02085 [Candidatus Aenigmatarchaeota archaeon]
MVEKIKKAKKKIMIDLDVVTTAIWDKKRESLEFLERVKKGEFSVYTPFAILDTLSSWQHEGLKDSIKGFYELYSTRIISAEEYLEKSSGMKIDGKKVSDDLAKVGIKEEDALLVVVSAIFGLDAIVTYNRKHLHKNKDIINEILRRHKLNEICILLPSGL